MVVAFGAHGLKGRLVGLVLQHPVLDEFARLNVVQHCLHGFLAGGVDHARARHVLAILSRVRHGVVHVGDAALIDEVDDQLHLMDALEISHLRRVAGFDQCLVTIAHQLDQAPTQNRLLTEEIGLAFLTERGLDDAGPATANGRGVRQRQIMRSAGGILSDGHEAGHAGAALVLGTHRMTGALRRHHADIHVGTRLDQIEMNVQAVGEKQRRALFHIGLKVVLPDFALELIRGQHHHHVGPFGGVRHGHDLKALAFGLGDGTGTRTQANGNLSHAGFLQVQRMRVSLAAITDNGDLLAFDQIEIGIPIVINAHTYSPWPFKFVSDGSPRFLPSGPQKYKWSLHPLRPASEGRQASATDLDEAERLHRHDELFDPRLLAGDLEHKMLRRVVDDHRAKALSQARRLGPLLALAGHFDHGQLTLERLAEHGQVDDRMDWHKPIKLTLDLLDDHGRAGGDDGDARQMRLMFGLRHGERLDVVAAAREQADDARKHSGLVVHEHAHRMGLGLLLGLLKRIGRSGLRHLFSLLFAIIEFQQTRRGA